VNVNHIQNDDSGCEIKVFDSQLYRHIFKKMYNFTPGSAVALSN